MNPGKKTLLLTEEEQKEILARQGVDYVVRCPFIPQISHMEPEEFIDQILIRQLHAKQKMCIRDRSRKDGRRRIFNRKICENRSCFSCDCFRRSIGKYKKEIPEYV